jgi:Tn3 transposase DDE domain
VLDGLLYHESDLRIEEHYTDTSGFTDHVFALMHQLGFRFAPRIRDLPDKRLFVPRRPSSYPAIRVLIGGTINAKRIRTQWNETLRLVTSIKHGTVTASLMLRKLSSYPRQNGLAVALREIGQIERTLFTLDWLQYLELRRRVHAGLNKGEAKTPWRAPSFSTALARSAIAASSTSVIARADSTSSLPPSSSGTRSTSNARSRRCPTVSDRWCTSASTLDRLANYDPVAGTAR